MIAADRGALGLVALLLASLHTSPTPLQVCYESASSRLDVAPGLEGRRTALEGFKRAQRAFADYRDANCRRQKEALS
jgi:uncharacterized protein YecT (DUF1311 family)